MMIRIFVGCTYAAERDENFSFFGVAGEFFSPLASHTQTQICKFKFFRFNDNRRH